MSLVPEELSEALQGDQIAAAAFDELPTSERTQHAQWVAGCRTPDTRAARARDVVRIVRGQAERRKRELKRRGPSP